VTANGRHVDFHDEVLEGAIRRAIKKTTGDIAIDDMRAIYNLDLNDTPVQDISDLAHCTNLEALALQDTRVATLEPLCYCKELKILSINGTEVKDLSPIGELTHLRDLFVGKTRVSDVSSVAKLHRLRIVSFAYSPVESITPLMYVVEGGGLKMGTVYLYATPLCDHSRYVVAPSLRAAGVDVRL
jgi:Leucine-rich repeat (LRR) protein